MAQLGSFALLLALALSFYSFLAGILALAFQNQAAKPGKVATLRAGSTASADGGSLASIIRQGSERLGETARRAGVATFVAVLLASVVLVVCAFHDDFSIAYIFITATGLCPVLINS